MPDRERIIELLDSYGVGGSYAYDLRDEIDECYALELAAAEKWRKFLAIQSCNDCPACPECPCDGTNCPAIKIEDAFEGNREEKDAKML